MVYDDTHGLWGGVTISVRGDGNVECHERAAGEPRPHVTHAFVSSQQIVNLLRLLMEQRGWEHCMPRRKPMPDERIACLRISVEGRSAGMWELENDMAENQRLLLIKNEMERLARGQ